MSKVRVTSATFAPNLGSVEVVFNGMLDDVQSVVCAVLLGEVTMARLGAGTVCKWRASSLIITLGAGSTMAVNDTIHLLSGMVLDVKKCTVDVAKVAVELPLTVLPPIARIQAPSFASSCDDVVLTTAHSTLRGIANTITYSVVGAGFDVLSLFLSTQSGKFSVRIPTDFIPLGNVTVAVQIADLVSGMSSVATAQFQKLSAPRPSLNINTAVRSHISTRSLQLHAEMEATACMTFAVTYIWKVTPPLLIPAIPNNAYFFASANSFTPNTLYFIEVSVTNRNTSYTTSSTFRVFVEPVPVVAVLLHPSYWEQKLGDPFTLKGSCAGANSSQYVWTCLFCSAELLQALTNITATSIVVNTSTTWRPQRSRVVLTCDKAESFTDIEFVAPPAAGAMTLLEVSPTLDGPRKVSANARLVVTGVAPASYKWLWVCESHVLELTNIDVCPTGPRGRMLSLRPGALASGTTYIFRANVTTPNAVFNDVRIRNTRRAVGRHARGGGTVRDESVPHRKAEGGVDNARVCIRCRHGERLPPWRRDTRGDIPFMRGRDTTFAHEEIFAPLGGADQLLAE